MAKSLNLKPRPERSIVLGTAGHIDHGKTSLVLALTGMDADRLPEEKARGITIDLGFAFLRLESPAGEQFEISLVDVPGHHGFVRNMLAGAGGVDAVMLIVAADEGVRAQTREHLQICQLLGIQRGFVVLTKVDLVSSRRRAACLQEVKDLVQTTFLQGSAVLEVSARTGEGIDALRAELASLALHIPTRDAGRMPRLPVDRVFSVRGFGTVCTGTLHAGSMHLGQTLDLQPRGVRVRLRGAQVHGVARDEVIAPNRVALNLAGVEVAEVERGDVLTTSVVLRPSNALDVRLDLLPGVALRHRQRVKVYALTAEAQGTALFYADDGTSDPSSARFLRLKLDKPLLLFPGDRFVIRQPSPAETLGGGVVLDAQPLARQRKRVRVDWLRRLDASPEEQQLLLRVERCGTKGCDLDQLVAETGWTEHKLRQVLSSLLQAGSLIADEAGSRLATAAAFTVVREQILRELIPNQLGLYRAELASKLQLPDWIFAKVLATLVSSHQVALHGDRVALRGSEQKAESNPGLAGKLQAVEQIYRAAGLAPPLTGEAAERLRLTPQDLRSVLTALLRTGALVRLGSDSLLVHHEALTALVADLRQHRGKVLDVGAFKVKTGLTRKHAIPLLEYLDGRRVTRLTGKVRVIC